GVLVVDAAVVALLLPREARVEVGDRPVPVIHVGEGRAAAHVAVLPRLPAGDDGTGGIPAGHLTRRREAAEGLRIGRGALHRRRAEDRRFELAERPRPELVGDLLI